MMREQRPNYASSNKDAIRNPARQYQEEIKKLSGHITVMSAKILHRRVRRHRRLICRRVVVRCQSDCTRYQCRTCRGHQRARPPSITARIHAPCESRQPADPTALKGAAFDAVIFLIKSKMTAAALVAIAARARRKSSVGDASERHGECGGAAVASEAIVIRGVTMNAGPLCRSRPRREFDRGEDLARARARQHRGCAAAS